MPEVVADLAVGVGPGGVVVHAQVVEACARVGQEVPDDHEDGAGDRDHGFELAAAFDDASVAFAEEGLGLGGRGGGLAEDAFEVGVALAGLAAAQRGAGLDGAWGQFRPGGQVPGGGETGHVRPDLGQDDLCSAHVDPGDLVQPLHHGHPHARTTRTGGAGAVDGAVGPVVGQGGQEFVDPGGQGVDLAVQCVDGVQQHPGQFAVVVVEPAGQRLDQFAVPGLQPAPGQPGQPARVTLPADQRLDHVPDRGQVHPRRDARHLDQRVLQQLLQPLVVPGPFPGQVHPQPGVVPQPTDLRRRHERGPQHPPLGQLGQPDGVQLVGLRPARDVLHVPGVDQLHVQTGRLQQVEPDPPVVRRGLHGDLLHPGINQLGRQIAHRPAGRRDLPHPAGPAPGRARHPGAHHPRRLRHIDRADPLDQPFMILIEDLLYLSRHRQPSRPTGLPRRLPGGLGREPKL